MISFEVHKLLLEKKLSLAIGESCTGGALSAALVAHPDASKYLQGSIVAYNNRAKIELLDVLPETLDAFGPVSREVVEEMAFGACKKLHAAVGVAVSGYLGPTGDKVGFVVASIVHDGNVVETWTMQQSGSRQEILTHTVEQILERMKKYASRSF